MIPNLSCLRVADATEATLFQEVSRLGGGKSKCKKFTEPLVTKEDEDPEVNCAVDGFLMAKPVQTALTAEEGAAIKRFGKVIRLTMEDGEDFDLKPLLTRFRSGTDRRQQFEIEHYAWIKTTFPLVCARGKNDAITWKSYGAELAKLTEWYFLDQDEKRGHLFLQLFDTPQRKLKYHMPVAGAFAGRYLYVALVCAAGSKGFGKRLMAVAEKAAQALGCTQLVLASLSNSVGPYFSQGFQFFSSLDGMEIDVQKYVKREIQADGTYKVRLLTELDIEEAVEQTRGTDSKRMREEAVASEDEPRQPRPNEEDGTLYRIIKSLKAGRARMLPSFFTI